MQIYKNYKLIFYGNRILTCDFHLFRKNSCGLIGLSREKLCVAYKPKYLPIICNLCIHVFYKCKNIIFIIYFIYVFKEKCVEGNIFRLFICDSLSIGTGIDEMTL